MAKRLLALCLALLGLVCIQSRPLLAADAAAGKALAEGCAGCHGDNGVSQMPETPTLAGEPDDYLQWQLVYFRAGSRKSEVMQGIAQALGNEDIRNLGAYYSSLPPPKPQPADAADTLAQTGERLAAEHRCKSCHSDDFSGMLSAARLAGQREDVLFNALRAFKGGKRVGSGVASMSDVVYDLNDDDMRALAHFLSTRP